MEPNFFEKLQMPPKQLWANYKGFFIVFGVLILIYKFRDIILDLLVSSSHRTVDEAQEQGAKLKAEEDEANKQANQLRREADELGKNKPVVDEDWNQK